MVFEVNYADNVLHVVLTGIIVFLLIDRTVLVQTIRQLRRKR